MVLQRYLHAWLAFMARPGADACGSQRPCSFHADALRGGAGDADGKSGQNWMHCAQDVQMMISQRRTQFQQDLFV
jgi:hypothetical protein